MANVRHSPSVTLYFTHASSSLSPLPPSHFEATSFSHPSAHREAHTSYEPADSFLFLIREPGPGKRNEARRGREEDNGVDSRTISVLQGG